MSGIGAIFKRIPYMESLRSFLEQWGLWPLLGGAFSILGALAISAWAWLETHLPYWAIAVLFLGVLVLLLAIMNQGYSFVLKRKQLKMLEAMIVIDRDELADQLEDMSRKIAALVGEYRGPMQEAWWKDSINRGAAFIRDSHVQIEGKLIEKFSYRFGADMWRLIRRAMKVVPIDRNEIWQIQHGARGEHDLIRIYIFLATLADDVRTPKTPFAMVERRNVPPKAESASS